LTHIESRPAKKGPTYDFFVDIEGTSNEPRVKALLSELKDKCFNVTVMGSKEVPWFPRKMSDIDLISQNVLGAGAELESDHPGFNVRVWCLSWRASMCIVLFRLYLGLLIGAFTRAYMHTFVLQDPEYRQRRKHIADLAISYKFGTPIPRVEYINTFFLIIHAFLVIHFVWHVCYIDHFNNFLFLFYKKMAALFAHCDCCHSSLSVFPLTKW
jgi:hypothetical protein